MKYQHPDGRVLFINDISDGTQWGVFWMSSTGGSYRLKTIPMTEVKAIAQERLDEYASKHKCRPISEDIEQSKPLDIIDITPIKGNIGLETRLSIIRMKVKEIEEKVKEIGQNFIEIGNAFIEIDNLRLYQEKGYKNIVELAVNEFKISKTTLYNLTSVAKKFASNGRILEGYESYSFSQLVEMVSIPENLSGKVNSEMSVKEIQQVKKEEKQKSKEENEEVITNNANQSIDNGKNPKLGTFECPDSGITARVPFPNFMCRQCKNHQDCAKYKENRDDIEKQVQENTGVKLEGGSLGNNEIKEIKEELSDIIKKNNEKIRSAAVELINSLQECAVENGFRFEAETDQLLTRIGQYRLSIIERQFDKK